MQDDSDEEDEGEDEDGPFNKKQRVEQGIQTLLLGERDVILLALINISIFQMPYEWDLIVHYKLITICKLGQQHYEVKNIF